MTPSFSAITSRSIASVALLTSCLTVGLLGVAPAMAQDSTDKPLPPPFSLMTADWSGRANVSTSMQKGNSDTKSIDFDTSVKAQWDNKDRLEGILEIGYEKDEDNTTVDDRAIELSFDDFVSEAWYVNYDTRAEQDDVAGVELRWNTSVGLGHQLYDEEHLKVNYSAGLGYIMEESQNTLGGTDTEETMSYNWKFNAEKSLKDDSLTFYHKHSLVVPANETQDYIFESNTGARVPLRNNLVASLDIEHDIDQGVATGTSKEDTKYSLKLGYEW